MNLLLLTDINACDPLPLLGRVIRAPKPLTALQLRDIQIADFEKGDHSPPSREAGDGDPARDGWIDGFPPGAGWWIVGSKVSNYHKHMLRAYFDGNTWREFVGLKDSSVRGTFDGVAEHKRIAARVMWLRPCDAADMIEN